MLIKFRLAAVHLSELKFGKLSHLKDSFQSCLAHSDSQESVNLQSIKNKIHKMIFSRYVQDSGNVTSWRLGDINFQFFPEVHPLDLFGKLIERDTHTQRKKQNK